MNGLKGIVLVWYGMDVNEEVLYLEIIYLIGKYNLLNSNISLNGMIRF